MAGKFKLSNSEDKTCPLGIDGEPEPFYCPRYRNRGTLDEFLGDTQPTYLECVAVRTVQWLNGCESHDWTHENWLITCIRETGPGMRIGYFLTSFSVVVLASVYLDTPLVGQYELYSPNRTMQFGNVTLTLVLVLWAVDYGLLCMAYFLIRYHGATPRPGMDGECAPFYRLPVRKLREYRVDEEPTAYTWAVRLVMGFLYLSYFVLGLLCVHTVLSHMYMDRNPWFAAMLVLKMVIVLVASIDDLSQIGSPWGIQEASKTASVLLCVRGLVLVPATLIWSGTAIAASFPPSECVECYAYG